MDDPERVGKAVRARKAKSSIVGLQISNSPVMVEWYVACETILNPEHGPLAMI